MREIFSEGTYLISKYHGDYHSIGGSMGRRSYGGRILFMLKNWLPNLYTLSFGQGRANIHSKYGKTKGVFLSTTNTTALALGGILSASTGVVPMLVTMGTLFVARKFMIKKVDTVTSKDVLKESFVLGSEILKNLFRIIPGVSKIPSLKRLSKEEFLNVYETTDSGDIDYHNYNALVKIMSNVMTINILAMVLYKMLHSLSGDDDEEKKRKTRLLNLTVNRLFMIQNEFSGIVNPISIADNILQKNVLLKTWSDISSVSNDINDMSDVFLQGDHRGENKTFYKMKKLLLPTLLSDPSNLGFESQERQIFTKGVVFDSWFQTEDEQNKKLYKELRATTQKKLKDKNPEMSSKDINDKVNKMFPAKIFKTADKDKSFSNGYTKAMHNKALKEALKDLDIDPTKYTISESRNKYIAQTYDDLK